MLSSRCILLGILIILVYYTVLFYPCDRYQENQLCPEKKPGFPASPEKKYCWQKVYKI